MKYTRFEELPVWNQAIQMAEKVYSLGSTPILALRRSLRDQIERAAVSVSNNIAEGFERGTTKELLTFLYIARGSAGEVRSMLCLMERLLVVSEPQSPSSNPKSQISNLKSEISNLKSLCEQVSRQLRAWAQKLQDSPIPGQRYLTAKQRRLDQARQEREAFLGELRHSHAGQRS
jgi:four helix bundle protein